MTKLYNDELHLSESQTTIFAALCELSDIVITTFGKPHAPSDAHLRETYAGICGLGWLSWYSDSQRAGLSGDRIPVGRRDFPHSSRPTMGPTQPPMQGYRVFCVGVERLERGVDHPPPT